MSQGLRQTQQWCWFVLGTASSYGAERYVWFDSRGVQLHTEGRLHPVVYSMREGSLQPLNNLV